MKIPKPSKIIFRYTLIGVLFGLMFPICAIIFEVLYMELDFSLQSIYHIHINNKLLFMIDTAPIFLGLFAYVIGIKSHRLDKINKVLEKQSLLDELTSLHNRRYAKLKIEEYISGTGIKPKLGIFLLDLNRFKTVNDTLGHNFGDELLKAISNRLLENFGSPKNLIRLGGDEFLVLKENMDTDFDFYNTLDNILKVFKTPFVINKQVISIQSSVGISMYPTDGDNVETLLRKADIAMYNCKFNSHCSYVLYKDSMAGELNNIFDLELYLRHSIENNELYIVYQPIVDTIKDTIAGVEALLRWNSTQLGNVPPDRFIPISEENGFIIEIGKWVLENACIQGKKWHDKGIFLYLSVNVSVEQFKDVDFIDKLKFILDETGFNPEFLHLEITENISVTSIPNINSIFEKLKLLNIKISFDDFGTGYSSFPQLKALNTHTLKIDKSFIKNIHLNVTDALITAAIIKLAKSLNLNVIAEGVETKEQLQFLQQEQCFNVQGYLYSKPIPPDKVEEYYYNSFKEKP